MLPQTVTLPPAAAALLVGHAAALAEWGFTIEAWGEGLVRVRAVPAVLAQDDLQTTLLEIADYLAGRKYAAGLARDDVDDPIVPHFGAGRAGSVAARDARIDAAA